MRKAILPLLITLLLVGSFVLYSTVGHTYLARREAATLICETRVLPAIIEADGIVAAAQRRPDKNSLPTLVAEGRLLKERLLEVTNIVRSKVQEPRAGARALRAIASLPPKELDVFSERATDAAMKRCPERAKERPRVLQAMKAVAVILATGPRP